TWFCEDLDAGVERAFRTAVDALGRAGAVLAPADIGWQHDPNVLRDIYNCEPLPCYGDGVAADPAPYEPFIGQDVRDGFGTPRTWRRCTGSTTCAGVPPPTTRRGTC